ncbi:GxxExxY protein [Azospirillum sp. sgz301742]
MRFTLDGEVEALTECIIGAGYEVHNGLGHGFVEAVYKKAFICELRRRGLDVGHEVPFQIDYEGDNVSTYYADLVIERRVIVELKAVESLLPIHGRQVLNYLRASGLRLGLLFNFGGSSLTFRRVLLDRQKSVKSVSQSV